MARETWTEDRIEELRSLAAAGHSQREIAERMGLTKGQVAGQMDRHKIPAARPRGRRPGLSTSPISERPKRVKDGSKHRSAEGCQWPHGDPGRPGFHFCGDPKKSGKPYCPKHCAIAYATSPSRAALPREAARL